MKIGNIDLGKYPLKLASMKYVTNSSFRLLCKEFWADMVSTEFVSSDALVRSCEEAKPEKHWLSSKKGDVAKAAAAAKEKFDRYYVDTIMVERAS